MTCVAAQATRTKAAPARLCKGPDGTRGFAAGRGRGLPPADPQAAAAAPGGALSGLQSHQDAQAIAGMQSWSVQASQSHV